MGKKTQIYRSFSFPKWYKGRQTITSEESMTIRELRSLSLSHSRIGFMDYCFSMGDEEATWGAELISTFFFFNQARELLDTAVGGGVLPLLTLWDTGHFFYIKATTLWESSIMSSVRKSTCMVLKINALYKTDKVPAEMNTIAGRHLSSYS